MESSNFKFLFRHLLLQYYKNGEVWKTNISCSGGSVIDHATTQTTYVIDCIKNIGGTHVTKSILVNVLLNYKEF